MAESKLATELERLRQVKGRNVSLREVERQTGISNEYLSQLERGIATKPAPDVLQKLSKFYAVSYESLLIAAGYLKEPRGDKHKVVPRDVETIAEGAQFSSSEWEEVRDFMTFIAARKHRGSK
jgi:transcriptional regulator with XRE-family HTH domain